MNSKPVEENMKKLIMTMLTVLACGATYALPVGNPSDASLLCDGLIWEGHCGDPCDPCLSWCEAISMRFGFYGDYVFNRHLELEDNGGGDIEQTQIFTNAGYLALNIWDRLDVFATLGATNLKFNTNLADFTGIPVSRDNRLDLETSTNFSWSVGARATLWECGCTTLGLEGQYFRSNMDVRRLTARATSSAYPDNNVQALLQEWQVGLGISHRINMFVPYVAVKYSRARLGFDNAVVITTDFSDTITLRDQRSKKHWGYAVGVSLVDCEKASLTVEGRFGDEKALYVNGQIRF